MSDMAVFQEKAALYDELVAAGKAPSLEEVQQKRAKAAEEQLAKENAAANAADQPTTSATSSSTRTSR